MSSFKLFKEYYRSRYSGKRGALSDEILLRGTSYIFIPDIFFSEVRTKEAEFQRISKQLRGFTVKEITFFNGNLC